MLSFTVRMRFDESDHDAIRENLIALSEGSRMEPGCISYIAHFVADDPSTVLIYEQYDDESRALRRIAQPGTSRNMRLAGCTSACASVGLRT